MKGSYLLLISFLIVGLLCIPAVSANEIYNETFTYSSSDYIVVTPKYDGGISTHQAINCFAFSETLRDMDIKQIICQAKYSAFYNPPTDTDFWSVSFTDTSGQTIGEGTYYYFSFKVGDIDYLQIVIDFDYIDLSSSSSLWVYLSSPPSGKTYPRLRCSTITKDNIWPTNAVNLLNTSSPSHYAVLAYQQTGYPSSVQMRVTPLVKWTTIYDQNWKNQILITEYEAGTEFILNRDFECNTHSSLTVDTNLGTRLESLNKGTTETYHLVYAHYPLNITLNPLVTTPYHRTIDLGSSGDPGDPGDPGDSTTLTVYIKNSQTGALIANSNIVIDALVNNEYYPVVNRTEPSGIFSINLQPTGGGPPNPDGYRLIVTADGYNNPMPEINFTVDDYKQSIYCLLDPIAGGPVDENKTFIDFFVSDMYANPVPDATVKFGKYTLITNSAGYTVFEVPKNDYYTYTVSKSGYNHITGNVNIGDAPRNTVNTYLTPVITPTTPTTIPTGGIPDEDDDSDGFLFQAVRGIGLAFGVGFSTAKIIFGMLLALSIGFATAKQLRGGAAEFGIGLLGGTMLGVLIGLLPVWIVVVLMLVVGLYVGNRYVGGSNSG